MLTVQVSQQHRLVAMHPNKVRLFSAATVHTAAAENGGLVAMRVGRLGGHTRVRKNGDDGEVEACWECCTHYELTFGTFNVRTAAAKYVNGIGHIDTLLRPCAAKGCEDIGLQETKWNGTFEIVTSGYRVYFGCNCSGARDSKCQHGVRLAIKKEHVKNAGKYGVAIECFEGTLPFGRHERSF